MNVNDTAKVSRVEVIDDSGRAYTVWKDGIRVWCDLQDDGRTLKVFIDGAKRDESSAECGSEDQRGRAKAPGAPGAESTAAPTISPHRAGTSGLVAGACEACGGAGAKIGRHCRACGGTGMGKVHREGGAHG